MPKTSSTPAKLPQIKAERLRTFHASLAKWYKTYGRHSLPWRLTDDPYAIWISEVMLQQTQVATVLERFYAPFLKTFPTIQHLANAPREKVLKAWEGLGYYRRAGYLHEAAKRAHNGLPDDAEGLMGLPGIGRNTAHAILAFAHHRKVAILEANVKRVVARIFAFKTPTEPELWAGAQALLNTAKPFDYNQAMMDLGATICTPKAPDCPACPANPICKGKANPEYFPALKVKKKVPVRERTILVLEDADGKLHLEQRTDALLGGLYGFPQVPRTENLAYTQRELHIRPGDWCELGTIVHIYSHFRLEAGVRHGQLTRKMTGPGWYTRAQIAALPLSGVDHKVLALVEPRHSPAKKSPKPAPRRARLDG